MSLPDCIAVSAIAIGHLRENILSDNHGHFCILGEQMSYLRNTFYSGLNYNLQYIAQHLFSVHHFIALLPFPYIYALNCVSVCLYACICVYICTHMQYNKKWCSGDNRRLVCDVLLAFFFQITIFLLLWEKAMILL